MNKRSSTFQKILNTHKSPNDKTRLGCGEETVTEYPAPPMLKRWNNLYKRKLTLEFATSVRLWDIFGRTAPNNRNIKNLFRARHHDMLNMLGKREYPMFQKYPSESRR